MNSGELSERLLDFVLRVGSFRRAEHYRRRST